MKLIGLPGRNPETEAWMTRLLKQLHVGHTDCFIAHYLHWDEEIDVDVQAEAARLALSSTDFVVAKSLGTMITLTCAERSAYPAQTVFIGTPIGAYDDSQRTALQQLSSRTRTLFIQQSADFTGSCQELRDLLPGSADVVEVAGEDHVYADIDELVSIISAWAAVPDR